MLNTQIVWAILLALAENQTKYNWSLKKKLSYCASNRMIHRVNIVLLDLIEQ